MKNRSKTLRGHCRTSGKCARLPSTGEANAKLNLFYNPGTPWFTILVRRGQILHQKITLPRPEHTNSPQGTMPYERGLSPVPPSEFSCAALADPKARFCRSLASYSTRQRYSACHLSKPLTLRHLTTLRTSPSRAWLCPRLRTLACPSTTTKTRQPNQRHPLN